MAALAIGGPALADGPTLLHPDLGPAATPPASDVLAQAYPAPPNHPPPPAYPSAVTLPAPPPPPSSSADLAPNPPPSPEGETPPPAPPPTYVWEPGHWYWNGVQYHWQPGRSVAKPTTTATYTPGHWEQRPEGWCGSAAVELWGPAAGRVRPGSPAGRCRNAVGRSRQSRW